MHEAQRQGLLCVISSPSGGGKTSIIRELIRRHPEYRYSISATTRPKRQYETDGKDYFFLSDEEFDRWLREGEFIEWAEVHGYRYGTPKRPIEAMLKEGAVVLLDIDVIGGMNVRRLFPEQSLLIFLKPPSLEVLKERLRGRKSESPEQIQRRLERLPMEMQYANAYDVQIVNDEFDRTVDEVDRVIQNKLEVMRK
jgi:guanylate kinase